MMKRECPECGDPTRCEAPTVDNGVGLERCGPYACEACGWVEEMEEIEYEAYGEKMLPGASGPRIDP